MHVATPGPVGLSGLMAAKLLGMPLVGSYHTELGPYALQLTRDPVIADVTGRYVDWFYRQCDARARADRRRDDRPRGARDRQADRRLGPRRRHRATSRRSAATRISAPRLLDRRRHAAAVRRALSPTRSGSTCCSRRSRGCGRPLRAPGSWSSATARPAPGSRQATPEGVAFLGELRGAALARIYASADVFCFPSTTDTFGQVILEAGASGLPTLAVAAGGAAELVGHGQTGLLVPPDDPRAFAAALGRLVGDSALRQSLGEGALAVAGRRTWERSFAELRDAYRIAVHGTPSELRTRIAA